MSQYVSIFIGTENNDELILIGYHSRNSTIGNYLFPIAPYGKLSEFSISVLDAIIDDIDCDKQSEIGCIDKAYNLIDSVEKCTNDINEKFEKIYELYAEIDSSKRDLQDMDSAMHYCKFLQSIISVSHGKLYYGCDVGSVTKYSKEYVEGAD